MLEKLWVFRPFDTVLQNSLVRTLSISPVTASILLARGSRQPTRRAVGCPAAGWAPRSILIPDMEAAVERLHVALAREERVFLWGLRCGRRIGTSLYLSFYRGLGRNACGYIPHRVRGYGLNEGPSEAGAGRRDVTRHFRLRHDVAS